MMRIIIILICFISGLGVGYITRGEAYSSKQRGENSSQVRKAPTWLRQDLGNAVYMGAGLSESPKLRAIIGRILKEDASLDFEDTLKQILESKENYDIKRNALVLLFSWWADVNFDDAVEKAKSMNNNYFEHFVKREIFTRMMVKDPKDAAKYYEKNREDLYGHEYYFLTELGRQWAMQSPKEAWKWLVSLDDGSDMGDGMKGFFSGLDPSPDIMEKYLNQIMDKPHLRENASVGQIVENWSKSSFKDVVKWIESLDEKVKNEFWEEAIIGGVENDFDLAISYLSKVRENFLPGELASVAEVMQRENSSEAALDWMVEQIPEGTRFPDFRVLSDWSNRDPESAKKWLLQFTPKDQRIRDFALEAYIGSSTDRNHEDTLELAESIKSPHLKKNAQESALRVWKWKDPDAARKWVEQFEGPEEIKKEWKKIVN